MPDESSLWYFAYGSNLDPATFVGRRRMRPLAARPGRVAGYRLVFDLAVGKGERAVANLRPDAGESVWGVAYELTGADAERLDETEGVHLGYYRRLGVEVHIGDGRRLEAFSYDSARRVPGRQPSPGDRSLILSGARHHGLPEQDGRFLEELELAKDARGRG